MVYLAFPRRQWRRLKDPQNQRPQLSFVWLVVFLLAIWGGSLMLYAMNRENVSGGVRGVLLALAGEQSMPGAQAGLESNEARARIAQWARSYPADFEFVAQLRGGVRVQPGTRVAFGFPLQEQGTEPIFHSVLTAQGTMARIAFFKSNPPAITVLVEGGSPQELGNLATVIGGAVGPLGEVRFDEGGLPFENYPAGYVEFYWEAPPPSLAPGTAP